MRQPNPASEKTLFQGGCHCGSVRFELLLPEGLAGADRCTCSLCRMRGAVVVSALLDRFRITQGAETLTLYTFNTGEARHYFCSVCGIYTHHRQRLKPLEYNVNVACLDGISPFDFPDIPVFDGELHPRDLGPDALPRQVGTLHFLPTAGKEEMIRQDS